MRIFLALIAGFALISAAKAQPFKVEDVKEALEDLGAVKF